MINSSGELFIANRTGPNIRKVTSGVISRVAGTNTSGLSGDGGAATSANFGEIWGLAIDNVGNIYISDQGNGRLRWVNPSGIVNTIAGATSTSIDPRGMVWDPVSNSLYVADLASSQVVKLTPDGSGGFAWSVVTSSISNPYTLSVDNLGNLFVGTNSQVHKVFLCRTTLAITPVPSLTVCSGNSITVTATNGGSGGGTYRWSGPSSFASTSSTVSLTHTVAGTYVYTVSGTNADGCTSDTTVTITANTTPTITATPASASICLGNSTTMTATGAATYTWSAAAGVVSTTGASVVLSPSATTTYTVTGYSAAGCASNLVTRTVTVNPLPNIVATTTHSGVCPGSSTGLSATGGATYSWSPSTGLSETTGSSVTATPSGSTTYVATGTDALGCTSTGSVTVTVYAVPTVTATATSGAFCAGGSTTLTASGADTYSWAPSTGLSGTIGTSVTASPSVTTTYTVIGTSTDGCTSVATVTVTVYPLPTITTATSGGWGVCPGGSLVATASSSVSGTTFSWAPTSAITGSSTDASATLSPSAATEYTITATSPDGCVGYGYRSVSIYTVPTISVSPASATICSGSCVLLTASGAATYSWTPGSAVSATFNACPTTTTTYDVTGVSSDGCSATTSVTITVATPLSPGTISGASSTDVGSTITLTASGASGGTWSSSDASVAAVDASGVVTGVSYCVATISYTVSNACGDVSATHPVAVTTSSSSLITTVGGTSTRGYTGDGGTATSARLDEVRGVCKVGPDLYISDAARHVVRKISSDGVITRFAGTASFAGFTGDEGPASSARLRRPHGLCADASFLYIADAGNNCIRRVEFSSGNIYTFAGTGGSSGFSGDGGAATSAQLSEPTDVCFDGSNNLYICDEANFRIRMVNGSRVISTFAGTGTLGSAGDGGPATAAEFAIPSGIAYSTTGNALYITDAGNNDIRKVNASGIISRVVGGTSGFSGDGGLASAAEINGPKGITADNSGNVFFADQNNSRVRQISNCGVIRTVAGNGSAGYSGDGGPATAATLDAPQAVCADGTGDVYMTDIYNYTVRHIGVVGARGSGTIASLSAEQNNIIVYPNPTTGEVRIMLEKESDMSTVYVMDITGKLLQKTQQAGKELIANLAEYTPGMYTITVTTTTNKYQVKVSKL